MLTGAFAEILHISDTSAIMISLMKNFTKEYDDTEAFMYQDITSNSVFPITNQTPINFEVFVCLFYHILSS